MEIHKTNIFDKWYRKLKDYTAKSLIDMRIKRLSEGNYGDSTPIGEGISEMRIHYGPGYRIYYKNTGKDIIILLCAGDKSSQATDIERAQLIISAIT
jgi:putative addiction module killer protein